MKRNILILITLLAIIVAGAMIITNNNPIPREEDSEELDKKSPLFSFPSFSNPFSPSNNSADNPLLASTVSAAAWQTFEKYLEYARNHDLEGIKSLSHQVSETCNDPAREEECFGIMDSVYEITKDLTHEDFKNIQFDERQIIMYTDGPSEILLFFTRDDKGNPKVLGMKFCFNQNVEETCVETDPNTRDEDGDGWWNQVESLFK